MLSMEGKCPICEGNLEVILHNDSDGFGYTLECLECGVRFDHPEFGGINGVEAFVEDNLCPCEDLSETEGVFECSNCGAVRHHGKEPAPNFCPECGKRVERW